MSELQYVLFVRAKNEMPRLISAVLLEPKDRPNLSFLVSTHLPYKSKDNGLPAGNELGRVMDLEEALTELLKPYGALHLGHITFDGRLQVVFHTREKPPAELSLKLGLLRKEKFAFETQHDPEWKWFEAEMTPNMLELEEALNRQLFEVLDSKGDRHSEPRQVDFGARFDSPTDRASFIAAISPHGFFLTGKEVWEPEPGDFWCEFSLETSIEPPTMAAHCAYLREQAKLVNGEFDGWATPVIS